MNQIYHAIDYQTENMLGIHYNDLIRRKVKFYSNKFYKILKKILKLIVVSTIKILKHLLFYAYIKKIIPNRLKIKVKVIIKANLLLFPKLTHIVKLLYFWLNKTPYSEKKFLHFLLSFFIKRFCLPLLHQMITNLNWRVIVLEQLKSSPQLRNKFKKIISEDENRESYQAPLANLLKENEIIISTAAQEIFKEFKLTLEFYENSY